MWHSPYISDYFWQNKTIGPLAKANRNMGAKYRLDGKVNEKTSAKHTSKAIGIHCN